MEHVIKAGSKLMDFMKRLVAFAILATVSMVILAIPYLSIEREARVASESLNARGGPVPR
jgi:hypothetical protein